MAFFARILGGIVFFAGLPILATDILVWSDTGIWHPMAVGGLWRYLDPGGMDFARVLIEENFGRIVWNPIIVSMLPWWAFVAAMGSGLGLILLFRRRAGRPTEERSYRPLYLVTFSN